MPKISSTPLNLQREALRQLLDGYQDLRNIGGTEVQELSPTSLPMEEGPPHNFSLSSSTLLIFFPPGPFAMTAPEFAQYTRLSLNIAVGYDLRATFCALLHTPINHQYMQHNYFSLHPRFPASLLAPDQVPAPVESIKSRGAFVLSSSRDYLISESPVVGIDWALGGFTLNTFVTACCERLTLPQNHIQKRRVIELGCVGYVNTTRVGYQLGGRPYRPKKTANHDHSGIQCFLDLLVVELTNHLNGKQGCIEQQR
ncbi:uncharacterized protein LACBIDRAFT_326601 [Laccaria bicolor S238N-H82]|uniref:Predicted protein n=1 Tax=Laccaria bicolor (strain S238N-H82 / ATCC MYA-4686) TaxID=486041 RepID=B0D965_LACBS|nr:uncharacterized protein LACBIDRAFT_326601 [Laccaria bicolor S238N-H82]EDR08957.1 predicted protein [Laccaria bicolor S238N-H82]|eukprot:XP_001880270.1 predicted protein [Laccaria bicolor S238N-H82]